MTYDRNGALRVGILMDSFTLPAWAYEVLATLQQSAYARIQLIVLNDSFAPSRRGVLSKVVKNWNALLYLAYSKLEPRVFTAAPEALEPRSATDLLRDAPILRVKPQGSRHCDWLADDDVERIRSYHLDVLVRLGFRILRGGILQAARYGVWSYHHGDNKVNRGGPPGFWEVLEGHAVTGSILQRLNDELDNGTVLCRSFSATDPLSVGRNQNNCYWKSVSFLPRELQRLHALGGAEFFRRVDARNQLGFYSQRLYVAPRNRRFVAAFGKHLVRYGTRKLTDALFGDQGILLFDLRNELSSSLWRFKRIVPPRDRCWADPHVVYRNGRYHIFIEEFLRDRGTGHIAVMQMDDTGRYSAPQPVLTRSYRLAYPFVFEWQGDYYMIPETSANKTVEVYRCVEMPTRWAFCGTLMENVTAVDTTLYCDGQKWWLFTNIRERPGASLGDELFLFYADTPLTKHWTAHPENPVVSDVRRSRPAGRLFEHRGQLYRPSRDSSRGDGYAVKINRVVTVSETEYREEEVSSIEPNWANDIRGVGRLSHAHRLTVVDARLRRFIYPPRDKGTPAAPVA